MGAVYLAKDTQLGDRLVAMKEMSLGNLPGQQAQEALEAFKHEAHILAGLQHPNLPSIHDHFENAGRWYLVMSFIQGETLEDYQSHTRGQKLSLEETLRIGQTLCDVLHYLHAQKPPIIFRDLKPSNIMRRSDGHIYLIDFGIARHFKPGQAKDTTNYGSAGYAPLEQYGKAQTTERSDIYSFGVTLYELLSGYDPSQSPFRFPPLQSLVPTLPERLVRLITHMLELDESKRPASIKVVQQELQQIVAPTLSAPQGYTSPSASKQYVSPSTSSAPARTKLVPGKLRISRRNVLIGTAVAIGGSVTILALASNATSSPSNGILHLGSHLYTYTGHSDSVNSIAWSPDGKRVASASWDKTVQVWDATHGSHLFTYTGHSDWVNSVAWSPDGKRIASASNDKTVRVWDATHGSHLFTYTGHSDQVSSVAWSPDGKSIASASQDSTVQIWDASNGDHVFTYTSSQISLVNSAAWSPDGKRVASASWDKTVQVWDASNGDHAFTYTGHSDSVNSATWSPDGQRIASASDDKTVRVWDASNGDHAFTYTGHSDQVSSAAWSPDGKRIVSASQDSTVQIWNATHGSHLFTYTGHSNVVSSAAWSPDGKRIASASWDNTVQVWIAS